jgi:hypothetical protein
MSKTRKVKVIMTRYYSKQVEVEVDVDENIKGEDLKDYLTEDEEIDNQFDDLLAEKSLNLSIDDDKYEFLDEENNFGGHL